MQFGIAADHAGYELKGKLLERMKAHGYRVKDFGACSYDKKDDYPDVLMPLARAVASGDVDRGIVICGSGVGACVASNKVRGVRACLVMDTYTARQGVKHANLNMLCLGGRVIGIELAWEAVKVFLDAEFSAEERHCRRVNKVGDLEDNFGQLEEAPTGVVGGETCSDTDSST